jgi:hypothetical protein
MAETSLGLFEALHSLRQSTVRRVIWADAICINQQDAYEKSIQVQMMGEIYARSQQVVVWLGEETEAMTASIHSVLTLHEHFLLNEPGYPYEELHFRRIHDTTSPLYQHLYATRETWRGPLLHFITRPWFTRKWIIQEIAQAPKATVVCGSTVISWEVLANVLWCFHTTGAIRHIPDISDEGDDYVLMANLAILDMIRRDSKRHQDATMFHRINYTRLFRCMDPRDVVYSLLGVAGDVADYGQDLIPDYNLSVEEVYKRFVSATIILKGKLDPLSFLHIPADSGGRDLPSWVADLSDLEDLIDPLTPIRGGVGNGVPFHAGGSFRPRSRISRDGKLLYVWGKKLDTIFQYCPNVLELSLDEDDTAMSPSAIARSRLTQWLSLRNALYGGNEQKFEAFWRTMICNLTETWDRPSSDFGVWFREYLWYRLGPHYTAVDEKNTEWHQVEAALENSWLWRFCETGGGRYGQVLSSVQVGDVVCILYGGELPYIIRPLRNGEYKFVGSCYMHGLMDGEGCGVDEVPDEEFCFR